MTLRFSTDRAEIVKAARAKNMSDAQILTAIVANEYGDEARKRIILEWASALGLTQDHALEIARRAALIKK